MTGERLQEVLELLQESLAAGTLFPFDPEGDGWECSQDEAEEAIGELFASYRTSAELVSANSELSSRLITAQEKAVQSQKSADEYRSRIERARDWVDDAPLPWDQQSGDECRKALLGILNGGNEGHYDGDDLNWSANR